MVSRISYEFFSNLQLFIHKVLHGYTSIIFCKFNFWVIYQTLTWYALCKKSQQTIFIKNQTGTKNLASNKVYHINIGTIKQIYHQVYKLYAYEIH